jgi:ATP-dependent Clp protease ATP-binding subunit ClpX
MFDLPGMENVDEIVVNEEAVTTNAGPLVIYGDAQREPASAG